jgi:hypothetical protein
MKCGKKLHTGWICDFKVTMSLPIRTLIFFLNQGTFYGGPHTLVCGFDVSLLDGLLYR